MESSGITLWIPVPLTGWLTAWPGCVPAPPHPGGTARSLPSRPPAHTLSAPGPGLPETLRMLREPHRALLSHERCCWGTGRMQSSEILMSLADGSLLSTTLCLKTLMTSSLCPVSPLGQETQKAYQLPTPAIKQRIRKYKTAIKMRRDPVVSASVLKTKPPCRRGRGALQIAVMWESGRAVAHTGVQPE